MMSLNSVDVFIPRLTCFWILNIVINKEYMDIYHSDWHNR
jgi:hypothetical protein